ncbi:MAG TPA: hypothetical protein VMV29_10860 [Ktedonobacterales bacterium]|nr:hypothetical protein [Ktedonobacterales bacterium]
MAVDVRLAFEGALAQGCSVATAMIPVVICTAAIREVLDIEGYLQAHGVRLVAKPFDIDVLLETVRLALLEQRHESEALHKQQTATPPRSPKKSPDNVNG